MGGPLRVKSARKGGVNPLLDAPDWELAKMLPGDAAKRPAWMSNKALLPKRPPKAAQS